MIVTNIDFLKVPCKEVSLEEGEVIAEKLFTELKKVKSGIGLASNQIGIQKRVCVINVNKPFYLINPRITEMEDETVEWFESCLSFPGKGVTTKRSVQITVEADNLDSPVVFAPDIGVPYDQNVGLLECICVAHEIDHVFGITMFDREVKKTPIKVQKKYGRNEKITIKKGTKTKILKWKKAESFIKNGWYIIDK